MRSWAASLALHGAAAGLAALLWLEPAPEPEAEPLRWQVAFAPAPVAEPAPAPPEPVMPPRPAPPRPVAPPLPPPPAPVPPPPPREVLAPVSAPAPAPVAPPPPSEPMVVAQAAPVPAPVPVALPVQPVTPPAPAPVVETAAEVERRWYLALLEGLRAMKRYPMAARRLGQEGVVLIEARIGRDGRLEGAEVKRGSGYPLLDKEALRLLEAAAETARGRLQPERPTRLEIPIAYRLEG